MPQINVTKLQIASERLQQNKEFFARLVVPNSPNTLNENGDAIVRYTFRVVDAAIHCNRKERAQVLRVIDSVFNKIQKQRYHFRTLLDGADGLSIGASTTGIVGAINGWNPIGWVLLGLTAAQTGSQIGMAVEGNKAKEAFQVAFESANDTIKDRLKDMHCIKFYNGMTKLIAKIKEVYSVVDANQMFMMLVLPIVAATSVQSVTINQELVKSIIANYANFYLDTNADAFLNDILSADQKYKDGMSDAELGMSFRAQLESGRMSLFNGTILGISLVNTVFKGILANTQGVLRATIFALSGSVSAGTANLVPSMMSTFARLSSILGRVTVVLSVIVIGFSIYSLVDRANEVKELDRKITESREKCWKMYKGIIDFAIGLKSPQEVPTIASLVGKRFALRSTHGSYISLQPDEANWPLSLVPWIKEWEHLTLQPIGSNGHYGLKATHGRTFARIWPGGEGSKVDTQTYGSDWERLEVVSCPNDTFAFKSSFDTYIRACPNGRVDCQTFIGPWEQFELILLE
jgi:hypothetical protein